MWTIAKTALAPKTVCTRDRREFEDSRIRTNDRGQPRHQRLFKEAYATVAFGSKVFSQAKIKIKEIPIKNANLKRSFLLEKENFKNPLTFSDC